MMFKTKNALRMGLLVGVIGLSAFGCNNEGKTADTTTSTTQSSPTAAPTAITTPTTASTSPRSVAPTASPPSKAGLPIGDTKELEDNSVCQRTGGIFAFAETKNYRVYICSDPQNPKQPKYYRSRNKDGSGGLDIEATGYNPYTDDVIAFKSNGYTYAVEIPTAQNPEPVLRVTFPDGKLVKEQLLRYLARTDAAETHGKVAADPRSDEIVQYVLSSREKLKACDFFNEESARQASAAFKVGEKTYVAQIQCFLAAYQANYEYFLYVESGATPQVTPLKLDAMIEEKGKITKVSDKYIAGQATFNPDSRSLRVYTKFRGLGDCGALGQYKFESDRFVLQEYRAKFACDGKFVEPAQYPVVYPENQKQ
jgi:hypothetical protein